MIMHWWPLVLLSSIIYYDVVVGQSYTYFAPQSPVWSYSFATTGNYNGWTILAGDSSQFAIVSGGYNGKSALKITSTGNALLNYNIDLSKYYDCQVVIQARIKASGITKPSVSYNGIKAMLVQTAPDGTQSYDNVGGLYGTFDWNDNIVTLVVPVFSKISSATVTIGMQDCSGTLYVDNISLVIFKSRPLAIPSSPVPYTGHKADRFRGVMYTGEYVAKDFTDLKTWGINLMRWPLGNDSLNGVSDVNQWNKWFTGRLTLLKTALDAAQTNGFKLAIDMHTSPGGYDTTTGDVLVFLNQTLQDRFVSAWKEIATKCKGHPALWGYDLLNEPLQYKPSPPGVLQWQQLANKTAYAIREVDKTATIIVEAEVGGGPDGFKYLIPIDDPLTVYSVHMYLPYNFTFQGIPNSGYSVGLQYPSAGTGDINTLRSYLQPVRNWARYFNKHIYVGEFSAIRWAYNSTAVNWLTDAISVFEENAWDWSYHCFREYEGWDVERGENQNDLTVLSTTKRKQLLLSRFSVNQNPYA